MFTLIARFCVACHFVALKTRLCKDASGGLHTVGFHVIVRLLKFTRQNHGVKGGVGFNGKRVDAHMGNAQFNRSFNAGLKRRERLPGNAAHQIDAHVVEALVRRSYRLLGSFSGMRATQNGKHLIIEALHPDGQTVYPQRPYIAHHGLRKAFRVCLHGALHIRLEPHGQAERVQQHGQPRHAHMRRRAAADVHRFNRRKLAFFRLAANLQAQVFNVAVNALIAGRNRAGCEIAIRAALHAKRDMQVQRAIRIMHGRSQSLATHRTRHRNLQRLHMR